MRKDAGDTWRVVQGWVSHMPEISFITWVVILLCFIALFCFAYFLDLYENSANIVALAKLREIDPVIEALDGVLEKLKSGPDYFENFYATDQIVHNKAANLLQKLGHKNFSEINSFKEVTPSDRANHKYKFVDRQPFNTEDGDTNIKILEAFKHIEWYKDQLQPHRARYDRVLKDSWPIKNLRSKKPAKRTN